MIVSWCDLHQRLGLICHNCVKFNGRESDYGVVTREFESYVEEVLLQLIGATSRTNTPTIFNHGSNVNSNNKQDKATRGGVNTTLNAVKKEWQLFCWSLTSSWFIDQKRSENLSIYFLIKILLSSISSKEQLSLSTFLIP